MPGIDKVSYLTNSTMMDVDFLPEHLVIVGGSYIGLEFAQMYRRFGAKVTVVEKGSHLIGREDPDISDAIKAILEEEGIAFRTEGRVHLASRRTGMAYRSASTATPATAPSSARMCCSPSAAGPTPTISASTRPA